MVMEEYKKARRAGLKAFREAGARGRYPYVTALDEMLLHTRTAGEQYLGIFEIPLSRVAGTKTASRAQSFAWNFCPILSEHSEFAGKWQSLYESQLTEGIRDPIKVYEYRDGFYVREGNKRVSVMKYVGAAGITADITRILPARDMGREVEAYCEYMDFNRVTHLFDILFSEPGSYSRLAGLFEEDLIHVWKEESVRALRSAFKRFSVLYSQMSGEKKGEGEAFLVYLNVFGYRELLAEGDSLIRLHMEKAWKEFELTRKEKKVALIEESEEAEGKEGKGRLLGAIFPSGQEARKLRIAFLNDKSPETSRWAYGHRLGWQALSARYGEQVEIFVFDNCDSADATRDALSKAILKKSDVIFTTAGQMCPQVLKAAVDYPEIKFLNCSVSAAYRSIRTYYPRLYEAKFILGAVAASLAEDGRICYVADYPVYGAVANINAFAIGAQMINPRASVTLKWSSLREGSWQEQIRQERFAVISGPDLKNPSEEESLFGLFCQERLTGAYREIAMPLVDWGQYYRLLVSSVLDGSFNAKGLTETGQAVNYFLGMSAGVVDVICSGRLPYATAKLASLFKHEVAERRLSPFDGEIHTRKGVLKEQGPLNSFQIVKMDWLNENIIGEIPPFGQFKEEARELLETFGVAEEGNG